MSDREDQLIDQRHQAVMDAIEGVHTRLDTLNGRTRTLENKVTVLSWAYALAGAAVAGAWAKFTGQGH
jgi:hypothetical protein